MSFFTESGGKTTYLFPDTIQAAPYRQVAQAVANRIWYVPNAKLNMRSNDGYEVSCMYMIRNLFAESLGRKTSIKSPITTPQALGDWANVASLSKLVF
jgi:hypothetical protein